jgi:putative MATE family efflux protein
VILSVILLPRLGLTGAGLAEGLSRAGGGITALVFLLRGKLVIKVEKEQFLKWQPAVVKRILHIGLPAAGEQLVRQSSQIVYTIIIASLGTVAIAANQVVMTVQMTSFMPGFGFGLAATTLVGQALGAKNPDNAERYGYETNKLAMIFMGVMGVIFFVWAEPLASFFVTDQEIVDLAALCLRVVAFAQIPFSAVMVISGGLRGAGDTRWVMYLTAGGQWGIRLVLSFILIWGFGFNLVGAWIAMLLDVLIRGFMTLLRYRSGKWKNILTIKQEKEPQVRFLESQ